MDTKQQARLQAIRQVAFRWHPNAKLKSMSSEQDHVQRAQHTTVTGTHYIADVGCENTLLSLRNVLTSRQEFCVHPPQYMAKPMAKHTPKPMAKPDSHQIETTPVFQCLSAGTNGQPKRIRRTHQSWIASFAVNSQLAHISNTDSYAIIGSLSHSLALYAALEAAHIGADLHALADLRPDRQLAAMLKLQSTVLYATPTQLRLLCKYADRVDQTALQVRHIFCGGGKLDKATIHSVNQLFQRATVQAFYGASETSFISITDQHTPVGSVGKAYPGVEILIDNTNNKSPQINASNIGEIWVKSPYLFKAYAETGTQAARFNNGFVSVGEIGYTDTNGYLFLTGRLSRRVNIADTVVYPEEVETALQEHASVSHCAIIPVEDKQRGCVLVAVVENTDNDVDLRQSLLVHLRQRVGPLKAPRTVFFVSSMPLLQSGKPDLIALEKLVTQQAHQGLENFLSLPI